MLGMDGTWQGAGHRPAQTLSPRPVTLHPSGGASPCPRALSSSPGQQGHTGRRP